MCVLERERDRLTFAPFGKNSLIQKGDCGRGIAVRFGGGAGGGAGRPGRADEGTINQRKKRSIHEYTRKSEFDSRSRSIRNNYAL